MLELEQYFTAILDGKINACDSMKRIAQMLLEEYVCPNEFHFDKEIAAHHIEFIETFCCVPTGKINTPLRLELFQKARLQAIFGFVDDNGMRQYNECLTIEGRKNGKTTELAAVEIDLLVNDGEGAPQIYNVATKHDQARLGFTAAHNMIRQSPSLARHIRKRAADLYFPANMGFIKPLSSNTNSLDGLDVHGAVIDELAAIKNRDLYDLIKQGQGARSQPLLFCISTNGFLRNGVFDAQYDYAKRVLSGEVKNKRFLPFIYELDSINEWEDETCWIKANPGLGTIKKYSFMKEMVEKAYNDATFKPTVLVKDFNMKQTESGAYMEYDELNNEQTFDASMFKYCIGGIDAADSVDLNAAKAICMRPGDDKIYVRQMYWLPESVIEKYSGTGKRIERDNAPYKLWIEQGYMRTCKGNKCDKRIFLEWFRELRDEGLYTVFIGYDPWHIDDSLLRDFRAEFGKNSMIPIRQGVYSLSQPMKDMKADFCAHNIVYNNNPIDKWCLINTMLKTDINGNVQPIKALDKRRRIDGTMALLFAYKVLGDKKNSYIGLNRKKE